VEIKSDEEQDEATPAKEDYTKAHFKRANKKLSALNLADLESRYRSDAKQHYSLKIKLLEILDGLNDKPIVDML
jgi:hypothetical protein